MDHELLVDSRTQDGQDLIAELLRVGFDMTVAFWVKTSAAELWYLYIGTAAVDTMGVGEAYSVVYLAVDRLPAVSLSITEIKLVNPTNPIAADAIAIRDRYRARLAIRYRGKKLGDLPIDEAYIYPRTSGAMTRNEVVQTVANLLNRDGALTPSLVTLRDQTQMQAIPVGMRINPPGAVQVVFRDLAASTDRSVSVDDVVSIW